MVKLRLIVPLGALFLLWAALALACNFPGFSNQPAGEQAILTAAAETTIARITEAAGVGQTPATTPLPGAATATPAAGEPSPTPLPSLTPIAATATVLPTPPGFETVFEDDFRSDVVWFESNSDAFSFELTADGYLLTVNFINGAIISVRSQDYAGVRVQAEAAVVAGPPDGYWGVACRQQDPENYYGFVLFGDGRYGILRNLNGEISFLSEGTPPAGLVAPGGVNRVAGACVGDRLTLFVNGQQTAETTDTSFASGNIGILAGTRTQEGMQALFTGFVIQLPQEP